MLISAIFCIRDKTYVYSVILCTEISTEKITDVGERSRLLGPITAYLTL
jgi:hypothetical protein